MPEVLVRSGKIRVCLILFGADISKQDQIGADIALDEPDEHGHAVYSQPVGNHKRLPNREDERILAGGDFGTHRRRFRVHRGAASFGLGKWSQPDVSRLFLFREFWWQNEFGLRMCERAYEGRSSFSVPRAPRRGGFAGPSIQTSGDRYLCGRRLPVRAVHRRRSSQDFPDRGGSAYRLRGRRSAVATTEQTAPSGACSARVNQGVTDAPGTADKQRRFCEVIQDYREANMRFTNEPNPIKRAICSI